MGWYGDYLNKAEVERDFAPRAPQTTDGRTWTHSMHTWTRESGHECLWYLVDARGGQGPSIRFVAVVLWDGRMAKPMSEAVGPYYFTCPLAIIEAAGEPANDMARTWRERCAAKARGEAVRP